MHAAEAGLGEGCVWSPVEDLLVWVDINGQAVHRFDHATGQPVGVWRYADTWAMPPSGPAEGWRWAWACRWPSTDRVGAIETVIELPGEPATNRANDGAGRSSGPAVPREP